MVLFALWKLFVAALKHVGTSKHSVSHRQKLEVYSYAFHAMCL